MKTKRNPTNEPLIMRLMMATMFLPVAILPLLIFVVASIQSNGPVFFESKETIFGIPADLVAIVSLIVIPVACPFFILWKARWRCVLIALATNLLIFVFCFTVGEFLRVAPEDRMIRVANPNVPDGSDVYCNGVLLGQVPLSIRVRDLKAKVPEWSTPPDQDCCQFNPASGYTWYPWDMFERNRYEQYRMLDTKNKKAVLKYDLESKYWWKIECKDMSYCMFHIPRTFDYNQNRKFDRVDSYSFPDNSTRGFFNGRDELLKVLALSYDQLDEEEKEIWCQYICSVPYFCLDLHSTVYEMVGKNKYEEMMRRVARTKYRFSENPDELECRRVLEEVIAENRKSGSMSFDGTFHEFGSSSVYSLGRDCLPSYALEQLGENAIEPIREMLGRNWFDRVNHDAPLLGTAGYINSPEMFDDMVRFYAASGCTLSTVFGNLDERALPLFHSVMRNKSLLHQINKEGEIKSKLGVLSYIIDDRFEPHIRKEIATITADRYGNTFQTELQEFVTVRIRTKKYGHKEMREWVESLHIGPQVKDEIIQNMAIIGENPWTWNYRNYLNTLEMRATDSAGITVTANVPIDPEELRPNLIILLSRKSDEEDDNGKGQAKSITTTDLCEWMQEHPDDGIEDFFEQYTAELPEDTDIVGDLVPLSLGKLAFDDSPEAGAILRRYWDNPKMRGSLIQGIRDVFQRHKAVTEMITNLKNAGNTIGRIGENYALNPQDYVFMSNLSHINPVMVEFFDEIQDEELCADFAGIASGRYLPGLRKLFEKWSKSENETLRVIVLVELPRLRKQETIHTQSRELFLQLAAGKITPDDLLPEMQPWVWQDGKYIQKSKNGE